MSTTLVKAAVKAERDAVVKYLREREKQLRGLAIDVPADAMLPRSLSHAFETDAALVKSVADAIEKGRHWK